jgi:glycosyltransferase involved in cell wall biosynthesis
MRIGIEAYSLFKPKAGIGVYLQESINYLQQADSINQYFLYAGKKTELQFNNHRWESKGVLGFQFVKELSTAWLLLQAGRDLKKDKIDIFWGVQGIAPFLGAKNIKKIITVHDAVLYLYPQTMRWDTYLANKVALTWSIKSADRILADSQATANDIGKLFGEVVLKKTSVVYPGIDLKFKPIDRVGAIKRIQEKFQIADKYIFWVGTIEPRKNLNRLLQAFKILQVVYKIKHQLVLAGAKGWRESGIKKTLKELKLTDQDVKFAGYVTDIDLLDLYNAADIVVFPSLYEGFGFPPLEAMACGTPVVAADIAVLRETLGSAAYFTDPCNPEQIAEDLFKVISDDLLQNQLITEGFSQAKRFSWSDTAEKLKGVFNSV